MQSNPPNKWLVTLAVVFGSFMAVLDSTIVNIAIPRLQTAFGVDIHNVQWVVTAYLLTMGALSPLASYLANNFGVKRSYLVSLLIFTLGSLLCGLSWDLPSLVFFRVLQAVGGAAILPLAITIILSAFPREQRGLAVSTLGVPTLLAPVLGPVLGGYIITYADWSVIFFVNVPIGVVGLLFGWRVMRESHGEKRAAFDLPGFLAIAYGAVATIYAVAVVPDEGWGSLKVIVALATGILALIAFVVQELRVAARGGTPLLDLRLFRYRSFAIGAFALVVYIFALFGATFLLPIYLQELRGQSAFDAGTLMIFQAIPSMLFSLVGGRLADRFGGRQVVLVGLVVLGVVTWLLAGLQLDTPFWWVDTMLALRGIGLGLVSQPLVAAALINVQGARDTADASTLTTVIRNIFASVGVAIIATLVQSGTRAHYQQLAASGGSGAAAQQQAQMLAMQDAMVLSVFMIAAAIIAVCFMPRRRSAAQPAPIPPQSATTQSAGSAD
jgi:EmrB/QacA subfamily drug resistance transporter